MQNSNEPGKSENKIFTIPNILSFFRICLIPVIIWLYLGEGNSIWAGSLLILSGLTDVLDGGIARRFDMTSKLGRALDPIADKLTQIALMMCLSIRYPLMIIPSILLVARDIYLAVAAYLLMKRKGVVLGAVWHGKVATFLLYATMIVHVFFPNISSMVSFFFIAVSTVMIAITFVLYVIRATKALRQQKA